MQVYGAEKPDEMKRTLAMRMLQKSFDDGKLNGHGELLLDADLASGPP